MENAQLQQLLAIFHEEALELTDEITEGASLLEQAQGEELVARLRGLTAVAHTLKGSAYTVGATPLGALAHQLEDIFQAVENDADQLLPAWHDALAPLLTELRHETTMLGSIDPEVSTPAAPAAPAPEVRRLKVETGRLEALATSASELLATRAAQVYEHHLLEACQKDLLALAEDEDSKALRDLVEALARRVQHAEQLFREQERSASHFSAALKSLRMQPIADQAPYWKQIVRDACERLERETVLALDVGDIEMDKQLLDELREPLMHLLRNAVGHGIETESEREALGKPPVGRLLVAATVQGEFIEIRVHDDGQGFNLERIAERAARQGLRADRNAESQDTEALLDLVFHDGFSTQNQVDAVSGRGVGLNVVRRTVERLGGTVDASASLELGGACFTLLLPTTILSTAGILVGVGDVGYVLPTAQVSRVLPFARDATQMAGNRLMHQLDDGEVVEVESLGRILATGEGLPDRGLIILLESSRRKLGIVVDRLIEQREFTAKPLPSNLIGRVPGISRATILSDGSVAPCLDVGVLLNTQINAPQKGSDSRPNRRVLIVDDSLSTRTLQKSVLSAAGYEVTAAVDGMDAWETLMRSSVDIVISDVQMPRLDGFGLLKKIRETPQLRDMPVILATSLASKDDMERGQDLGASDYIIKGQYDHQGLCNVVAKHL